MPLLVFFRRHKLRALPRCAGLPVLPAALLGIVVLAALAAPWLSPQDPYDLRVLQLAHGRLPPAPWDAGAVPRTLLGTDAQGRDMLSAVLYGLRVSLLIGAAATLLAGVTGTLLGLAAGWRRGWLDAVIMRLADVQLAFPAMLIALFMMALWGAGLGKLILAMAAAHWVIYARTARAATLVEREKDYVAASRALGAGGVRIVLRHILPNLAAPLAIISTVEFASIVMLEATLSFLGLGVPVTRPSLGMLIKLGYEDVFSGAWWVWLFPGLALVALVFSLNWLADRLVADDADEAEDATGTTVKMVPPPGVAERDAAQ